MEFYKGILEKWPWNGHFPIIPLKICPFITKFTSIPMDPKQSVIKGLHCMIFQSSEKYLVKLIFWLGHGPYYLYKSGLPIPFGWI